eukprot:TRINITY_DN8268_c0_g1_i4.p1 TRINITY_DN8268_c0_g1~~TRINITY_DN8268_c0_g1_i4.p1  ORF type:complete len:797 (+),score=89.47 TRINITY_DN8268_c0_g1_i4:136-2526(+)
MTGFSNGLAEDSSPAQPTAALPCAVPSPDEPPWGRPLPPPSDPPRAPMTDGAPPARVDIKAPERRSSFAGEHSKPTSPATPFGCCPAVVLGSSTTQKPSGLTGNNCLSERSSGQQLRFPIAILRAVLPELSAQLAEEPDSGCESEKQELLWLASELQRLGENSSEMPQTLEGEKRHYGNASPVSWNSEEGLKTEGLASRSSRNSRFQFERSQTRVSIKEDPNYEVSRTLLDVFRALDTDNSGSLSRDELLVGLRRCGLSNEAAKRVTRAVDTDGNGNVDFDEWRNIIQDQKNAKVFADLEAKLDELQTLHGTMIEDSSGATANVWCMMRPDSKVRSTWDGILVVLCAYLAVSLPFFLGFSSYISEDTLLSFEEFHFAIDCVFLVDVLLNFRTGVMVGGVAVIMDAQTVACLYLRSWFLVDLISSLPLQALTAGRIPNFRGLKLLKLAKLARILKLFRPLLDMQEAFLDDYTGLRVAVKHGNIILSTVILCHWLACGMGMAGHDWLNNYRDVSSSASRVYVAAMYWAMTTMTTVGYGDIVPYTDTERLFAIVGMVIGGAFYGYLVGTITEIVTLSDSSRRYEERMTMVLHFVDQHKLSRDLRKRVLRHFRGVITANAERAVSALTEDLSPDLVREMRSCLVSHDLAYNMMFTRVPFNALVRVQNLTKMIWIGNDRTITSDGDAGTAMYVITAGKCRLTYTGYGIEYLSEPVFLTETIAPGGSFGEEIITGLYERYCYEAVATLPTRMIMIEEGVFAPAFEYMPDCMTLMRNNVAGKTWFSKCVALGIKLSAPEHGIA